MMNFDNFVSQSPNQQTNLNALAAVYEDLG